MQLKQNNQIAIAFIKKLCRLSKGYAERFTEFLGIINEIEGNNINLSNRKRKIKSEIRSLLLRINN